MEELKKREKPLIAKTFQNKWDKLPKLNRFHIGYKICLQNDPQLAIYSKANQISTPKAWLCHVFMKIPGKRTSMELLANTKQTINSNRSVTKTTYNISRHSELIAIMCIIYSREVQPEQQLHPNSEFSRKNVTFVI